MLSASVHAQAPVFAGDWLLDGEELGSTRAVGLANALVALEDSSAALANPALLAELPRALEANAGIGFRGGPLANLTGGFRPARGWAVGLSLFNRPYDRSQVLALGQERGRLRVHVTRYAPFAFAFKPRATKSKLALGGALRVDDIQTQQHLHGSAGDPLLATRNSTRIGASVGAAVMPCAGLQLGAAWRTSSQALLALDADGFAGEQVAPTRVRVPRVLSYGFAWRRNLDRGRVLMTAQGEQLDFGWAPASAGVAGSLTELRARTRWTRQDWRVAAELGVPIGGYAGRGQVLELRGGLWRRGSASASALPAGQEQAASIWHVGASYAFLGWGRWRLDAAHHWGPARSTYFGVSFRFPDSFRADLRPIRVAPAPRVPTPAVAAQPAPGDDPTERTLNIQVVDGHQDLAPDKCDTTFMDSGAAVDGVHTWYPVTGFKETVCGSLRRFSRGCVSLFKRGLLAECDLNNDIELDDKDALRVPLELLRCQDARPMGLGERRPMCSEMSAGVLHTEITPPPQLRKPLSQLWDQWGWWRESVGGRMCVYGPLVLDAAHGFASEVHPAELMWWRQGRSPHRVWTLLWQQDASTRFDEADNFALRRTPDSSWRPWADAKALRGKVRLVVEVRKDTVLLLDKAHLTQQTHACPTKTQRVCSGLDWLRLPMGVALPEGFKFGGQRDSQNDNMDRVELTIQSPVVGGPDWEEQGHALELRECPKSVDGNAVITTKQDPCAPLPNWKAQGHGPELRGRAERVADGNTADATTADAATATEPASSPDTPVDARPERWRKWRSIPSLFDALRAANVEPRVLSALGALDARCKGLVARYFDTAQIRAVRLADAEGAAGHGGAPESCWTARCKNCPIDAPVPTKVCATAPGTAPNTLRTPGGMAQPALVQFCAASANGQASDKCGRAFWNVAFDLDRACDAASFKGALVQHATDAKHPTSGQSPDPGTDILLRLAPLDGAPKTTKSRLDEGLSRAFDLAVARVLKDGRLELGELEFLLEGLARAGQVAARMPKSP
jgi:hypothetical protein